MQGARRGAASDAALLAFAPTPGTQARGGPVTGADRPHEGIPAAAVGPRSTIVEELPRWLPPASTDENQLESLRC